MEVIVQHGRQQVVRGGNRVEIAGEMQVDLIHGDHLGVAAAGRTAFDSEYWA